MGMTIAVLEVGEIGSLPTLAPDIRYLSLPLSSSQKPIRAVQNPADTQQNKMLNNTRMLACST
ncbi:hypothetical protein D3C75_1025250 [compost metagenome]